MTQFLSDQLPDFNFVVPIIVQVITFFYMTKKSFLGKCSLVKNGGYVLLSILLNPYTPFFAMTLSLILFPNIEEQLGLFVLNDLFFIPLFMTIRQMIVLSVWTLLYVLIFGKKKRSLAAFAYLMSFTFTLFHIILCFCRFEKVYLLLLSSVVIYVLLFLFCRHIISHIIRLSKDERVLNRPAFYVLPAVHIFTSYYLYVFVEMSNSAKTLYIPLWIISSFLEMTLIVTFKTLLTNLSQLNEIQDKNIKLETARNEIKTLSVEVMEALAHTIDAKDEYTKGHSIRVANYSRMIAQKLGLSEEECENIYYMGLLHDLGKIGVPNEIINSPDRLTDEEYSVIKTHPGLGFDILSEIKSRPDLATGAKWHHERYDGKGYPDGKSGEDIPLMARIIAVADSYDAMTSNRSYRHYLPQEKVIDELRKNEGTQFDPSIAECMIGIIKEDTEYKMHE